ncbi:MAG: methionine--tRNA ligase [Phycisphaerales bacterium]|nr:methionine--tRNA ligase [Phycisphaerales bacterium]
MSRPTAYVSTPIYYVNGKPHIGHCYTTLVCDVWARFMRRAGRDVFFLTGTDEHGAKVEKAATEHRMTPQAWADQNAAEFRRVLGMLDLTNDDFIRTTEPRHTRQVQTFVRRLLEKDAVYVGEFEGWYDQGQEEYYTETKAKDCNHVSPISGRPLVRMTERNYYFRLSAFQKPLEDLFASHPDFVRPEARRNEVLGRLREGLQDVPMSRTNFAWGIPMPDDAEHVIYVWIDALFNYITALGLGEPDGAVAGARAKYWPAQYHVIGKEILWFHAVIWPAMLLALDLPLPECVYAHSYWVMGGQKMSKSLGNIIDLEEIEHYLSIYGLDAWRYYMTTQGPLGVTDSTLSPERFHEVYTTDLVNTVGNCASRVTAMINKYFGGTLPADAAGDLHDHDWPAITRDAVATATEAMAAFDLAGAMDAAVGIVRRVDGFIHATEPFKLAKDPAQMETVGAILYRSLEAVRIASVLLEPTMPGRMASLGASLGIEPSPDATLDTLTAWGGLTPGATIEKTMLFPRIDAPETAGA